MVGIVIVCHGGLGAELVGVAELIVGKLEGVAAVSVGSKVDAEKARAEIGAAVDKVRGKEGVLVLTDMFGGTPSNLALAFLDEDKTEVVTGVNLPMIIKYANHRKDKGLKDLVSVVRDGGIKSIIVASDMLHQKARS